MKDTKSSAKE